MKKISFLFTVAAVLAVLNGCRRNQTDNKVIDGIPVNAQQAVLPANAIQAFTTLNRDGIGVAVSLLNRLGIGGASFADISGPTAGVTYSFQTSDRRYGAANFSLQFLDALDTPVDPVSTALSSASVSSIRLSANGSSSLFNYTETLRIRVDTAGQTQVSFAKHVTGSGTFTGSQQNITFAFTGTGSVATFEGLKDGAIDMSGTGTGGAPVSGTLRVSSNHDMDGPLSWEGKSGQVHMNDRGIGYVVTNDARIFVD